MVIKDADPAEFTLGIQQGTGLTLEAVKVSGSGQLGQSGHAFLRGGQKESEVLFHPQHVLDGAFLLRLGLGGMDQRHKHRNKARRQQHQQSG
ncbi:hypothetical protein GCM10027256_12360 [Novispirillum itersonii subsp. nipponicum]